MPIQVEHLTHTYMPGSPFSAVALNDVSLTIEDGELIGLLGHTGSGKTTLVQHLNGLIKPTSGRVVVDGLEGAAAWVKANAGPGDLVVCMSCGDLYKAADKMVEQ